MSETSICTTPVRYSLGPLQVLAEVMPWDLPPLSERYRQACQSLEQGREYLRHGCPPCKHIQAPYLSSGLDSRPSSLLSTMPVFSSLYMHLFLGCSLAVCELKARLELVLGPRKWGGLGSRSREPSESR